MMLEKSYTVEDRQFVSEWEAVSDLLVDCRNCLFADMDQDDFWIFTDAHTATSDERFDIACIGVGVVYILEIGTGVKIGRTSNIRSRMKSLLCSSNNCGSPHGRLAFSPFHGNFVSNERQAHRALACFRTGRSEFFGIRFDDAVRRMHDVGLVYGDADKLAVQRKLDAAHNLDRLLHL